MKNSNQLRWIAASVLIFIAALSRLIPHEANFTPILAIGIFGAAMFRDKRWMMFAMPLAAMFVSDLVLGLNSIMLFTYGSIAGIIALSSILLKKKSILRVGGASIGAAVLFFLVTNFGSWLMFDMYSHDAAGLILCYEMAIPFFRNTLASTLAFAGALFGLQYAVEQFILKPVEQN
jgi:hypothetical protein